MTTPHELRRRAASLPTGHPERMALLQERLRMLAADAEAARAEAEAEAEAQRATWREETLRDYMVNLAIQASTLRPASPERNAVHAAYREVAEELRRQG